MSTQLLAPHRSRVRLRTTAPAHKPGVDAWLLAAAMCATPLSIAATEILLALALAARIALLIHSRTRPRTAPLFGVWLVWAIAEIASWRYAGHPAAGIGEMRHLLLIAALFFVLPTLDAPGFRATIWRGIFVTSTIGCLSLIAGFIWRTIHYKHEIATAGDAALYLRSGGLLHHWMIFAVVEILVFSAMLRFHADYPEHRKWLRPLFAIHAVAIIFSLTRALWLGCIVVLALHLLWRRSRWILALPIGAALLFIASPGPVRARITESFDPVYYSNADRLEMWRVGVRMIRANPWSGVGPGRIESLFTSYTAPSEALPAYHGHLHDNALQLAAQFGLPVLAISLWFLAHLVRAVRAAERRAASRELRFLASAALLGLVGYLILGVTDYTYGHSLGLILAAFTVLPPGRLC